MRRLALAALVASMPSMADGGPWHGTGEVEGRLRLPPLPPEPGEGLVQRWNEVGLHLGAFASLVEERLRLGLELRASLAFFGTVVGTSTPPAPEVASGTLFRVLVGPRVEVDSWRLRWGSTFLGVWAGAGGTPFQARSGLLPDFEGTALLGVRWRREQVSWSATVSVGVALVGGGAWVPVAGLALRGDL